MAASALAKKLRLQPDQRVLIRNAPDGYADLLAPLPDGIEIATSNRGTFDFAHFFVRTSSELQKITGQLARLAQADPLLWVSYPKKTSGLESDLSRDILAEIVMAAGLRTVALISVDNTWSAMRLRAAST